MDVRLRVVNQAWDACPPHIVLFQQDRFAQPQERPIAWKVIQGCAYDCYHPFVYSFDLELAVRDGFGNLTTRVTAQAGRRYRVIPDGMSIRLTDGGPATQPGAIGLVNELCGGTVDALTFRNDRLVSLRACLLPGSSAYLSLDPILKIGALPVPRGGESLPLLERPERAKDFQLNGVTSGDLVMTGGGPGSRAKPFDFHWENLVMA